jgi:hypothetical protein
MQVRLFKISEVSIERGGRVGLKLIQSFALHEIIID